MTIMTRERREQFSLETKSDPKLVKVMKLELGDGELLINSTRSEAIP
jgi:hypothetical protein